MSSQRDPLIERLVAAVAAGDERAIEDVIAAMSEHAPDRALSGEWITVMHMLGGTYGYGDAIDKDRLAVALTEHPPSDILDDARAGLDPDELYEWIIRAAVLVVDAYNDVDETGRLPDLLSGIDRYDFRQPGFVPDAYNSLALEGEVGDDPNAKADEVTAAMKAELPTFGESRVIAFRGALYIVGESVRRL